MSTDAKTLYGILLDRMGLSVKNGWLDEQGRVYIIFPVQEVMDALGCADNKATKLFRELEKFGLIERKRRGLGKPNLIYVKNFADPRFRNRDMNDQCIPPGESILHHAEGVDLIPANIELAGLEVALVNSMSREKMLKQVLDSARREYDYILLDCTPSLGMLTVVASLLWLEVRTLCGFIVTSCGGNAINALAAADTTLIPVQAQYLSAKGLEQLLQTIQKVRRQINPKLKIEGILMTMTDSRTNYGREIDALIRQVYGSKIRVFEQPVPHSVRAAEISAEGRSIFAHDPKGKVAAAYQSLTREVLADAEKQRKLGAERSR